MKKDPLFQENEEGENVENGNLKPEISVAEIYKKYIMTEKNVEEKEQYIETFQNNNILKYSNKNVLSETEPPLLVKNPSL